MTPDVVEEPLSMTQAPRSTFPLPPSLDHLTARTVKIEEPGTASHLLSEAGEDDFVFLGQGIGLVARGVAARLELPHGVKDVDALAWAQSVVAAIPVEGAPGLPGTGPIALGAVRFDPSAPAALVIPKVVEAATTGGARFRTTLLAAGEAPPPRRSRDAPDQISYVLRSERSWADWRALIARAVADIKRGALEKVVPARVVSVETDQPISTVDVVRRMAVLHPSCTIFLLDGFLGASPELLLSRRGHGVLSFPLAGTQSHSADPASDREHGAMLLDSRKQRHEHQLVVDAVRAGLAPVCAALDVPATPSIVSLRNVMHLGTRIAGRLHDPPPGALELVARLHPTPAVCGTPRDVAAAWLREHERFDRERYGGAVGWVDARGDGDWVVGIRCAWVDGRNVRLVAGVGVVLDSVPDEELVETQLKLQAMLAAVVRP